MKKISAIAAVFFSGCFSITQTQLAFVKIQPPSGIRFYVSDVELSAAVRTLPFGKKPDDYAVSKLLRTVLVKHRGDLFSDAATGSIPLKVSIDAKPNRTGRLASTGQYGADIINCGYWESGWRSIAMMLHLKVWSLVYDVKCEITGSAKPQTVSRSVVSDGSTTEPPILFAPIMMPIFCFADDFHFNGFGLFPGMTDDYDWLMEKEFADVMASAVAEFDVDAIKGGGDRDF